MSAVCLQDHCLSCVSRGTLFSNYTYHLLSLTSLCMLFICNSFPIKAYTVRVFKLRGSSNSSRWKSLTHSYTCKSSHRLNQENQALLSKLKKNFPTQAPVLQQILSNQTRPDIR
ncbi:hypothetical protein IMY05_008G0017300 [Salix suchowensis]|nr:hypothetical protein IMY05_008G0017300 [Salix suchowensis]